MNESTLPEYQPIEGGVSGAAKRWKIVSAALLTAGVIAASAAISGSTPMNLVSSFTSGSNGKKVDVYIIAESFCPNCKEHSFLLDSLVMSKGDDMRRIMDLKLDMMVYDGWNDAEDEGMCEKGKWDCEMAKYHLAVQDVYASNDDTHKWWDFSRCLYKHQDQMIAEYVDESTITSAPMTSMAKSCAEEADLDFDKITDALDAKGTHLLKESWGRTLEYDMPVWIYVNGKYIQYEDDWINAICAAYDGDNVPSECSNVQTLTGGDVAETSISIMDSAHHDNDKVDVYIVAEAFCPNCKEHSYYFDKLVMTPEGSKSGVRAHMNLMLEQMVIDGWNEETNEGMCEKGKFDCELSKYHLCAQETELKSKKTAAQDEIKWWDYSRCLYEHQSEMIDYYYYQNGEDYSLMYSITSECAAKSDVDADEISSCVADKGTTLLKASYDRIGKMNDPVWIFVEGQRIDYHEDWLATICAAIAGKGKSVDECTYYADVRK